MRAGISLDDLNEADALTEHLKEPFRPDLCTDFKDETALHLQARVFRLEESAVLLNDETKTERIRQLHDQAMVLRGAAFDGMIAFSLCLFAWLASHRDQVPRLLLTIVPVLLLLAGIMALVSHVSEPSRTTKFTPPYMELTLISLGVAGCYLVLWKGAQRRFRIGSLLLSSLLTLTAYLAWWLTEVLYDQQIIYSFVAKYILKLPSWTPRRDDRAIVRWT